MIAATLMAVLSHWRRQPLQLGMLVIGLALATALWSAVQAINSEARASYAEAAAQISPDQEDYLIGDAGFIELSQHVALRRAGWLVSPLLIGEFGDPGKRIELLGIDILTHPMAETLTEVNTPQQAELLQPADLLLPPGRLFVHPVTKLPDTDLPPVIANANVPPGTAVGDIGTIARLLQSGSRISRLVILPQQPVGLPPLRNIAPDLIRQSGSTGADTEQLTRSFHLNLTAFGLLAFAVGLFIVQGTIALGIEQRRGMFRTLRSLGIPIKILISVIFTELAIITTLAALVGLALGYLIAAALMPGVGATLSGLYGADLPGSLRLRPSWVLSGFGMLLPGC